MVSHPYFEEKQRHREAGHLSRSQSPEEAEPTFDRRQSEVWDQSPELLRGYLALKPTSSAAEKPSWTPAGPSQALSSQLLAPTLALHTIYLFSKFVFPCFTLFLTFFILFRVDTYCQAGDAYIAFAAGGYPPPNP